MRSFLRGFALVLLFWSVPAAPLAAQPVPDSSFRIISTRYRLEFLPADRAVRGTDTLGIRLLGPQTGRVRFRLFPFYRVTGAWVDGRSARFSVEADQLVVEGTGRDSATLVLEYAGRINMGSDFARIDAERAVFHEEGALPTGLYELSYVRGSIVVPRGWEAVTVGELLAREERNDSVTFVWESRDRLASVGWICAGSYERSEERGAGFLVSTYLDTSDTAFAGAIRRQVRDLLEFYSGWFTPYRFSKLAVVEVDNAVAGRNVLAIASPSMILVKRMAFSTKDVFNQVASVLPHEVAHQWWPMTVFIHDEDAALLSEGMCEYSALVSGETAGKMTGRDSLGHHPLLRMLLSRAAKGEERPLREKTDLRATPTHYLKGSFVHNMLRATLGDSLFRLLYATYAREYALRTATMADFEAIAERLSQRRLDWFFRQWVDGTVIPRLRIYNVKTSMDSAGVWRTRGRVRLVGYEKFTTPVSVGVLTPADSPSVALWLGEDPAGGAYRNDVPFEVRSKGRPSRAILDPDGGLLKVQRLPVKLSGLRDRASGTMIVGSSGASSERLRALARRDSAAMELSGWSFTIKADTATSLLDLQQDYVFLYGTASENAVARDLQAKFPQRCEADSVLIDGVVLRDSAFSLLQAIENPYRSSGMITWVASAGAAARPELLPYDDSWVLLRGSDIVDRGVWEVVDPDLAVEIPAETSPKR